MRVRALCVFTVKFLFVLVLMFAVSLKVSIVDFIAKLKKIFFSLPTCYFSNGNHKHKLFYSPTAGRQNQREEVTRQLGPDEKIVTLE